MKSITAFAILALAATTWAVSPPGMLGFILNIHAFITTIYSALSNSIMLKSEENLEGVYWDWSDEQSGGRGVSGLQEEKERLRRIEGLLALHSVLRQDPSGF